MKSGMALQKREFTPESSNVDTYGVCVHVCACVRDVFAYNNNILPRLIMIIIKIIFLYFLEIAHTADSPQLVPS